MLKTLQKGVLRKLRPLASPVFRLVIGSKSMFGPDHLAGLRPGIRYPAWAPGGGAFGASPARALGRGGATVDGMRRIRPPVLRYF